MKLGDLVRVIPGQIVKNSHELWGDEDSPKRFIDGYDTLISTNILVNTGELCTVVRVGEPDLKHHWIRVLKNTGETGWITSRWLEGVNENR